MTLNAVTVVSNVRIISRIASRSHRPSAIYTSIAARSGVFCYQSKQLSVAMSTRVRSPTSDPAPLEKKIRLDHHTIDEADISIEDLGVPGPSKKASKKSKKKQKHILPEPYSTGDVLWRDVVALLGSDVVENALQHGTEWTSPFDHREEVEVVVSTLSSNGAHMYVLPLFVNADEPPRASGDALARSPASHPPWVIVAPFALPRERIRVRVYRSSRLHSFADLVEVITPNPDLRDDSRVECRYFGKCSGCQYQVSWVSVF
jgi:tRNA (uracil-5-)-methyltransferase